MKQPLLLLTEIENYVEKTLHSWNIPGASLLIWKDGETLLERGFGVRELGQPAPMEASTIFNIASSTKAFIAACLGLLVDEGRLSWDDPVVKYLPEFQVYDPWITGALTLRDLLNHHLGLRRYNRVSLRNDPFDLDEFLQHFPYMEPAAPFRTRFCYGNEQYLLASKVLEVISGKPFESFLQERLFTPLGMTSTYPTLTRLRASGEGNISHGHANLEGGFVPAGVRLLDPVQALPLIDIGRNAAGCIWSNLPDLARWLEFLLGQGTSRGQVLIRREVMQEMSTPQVAIAPRDEDITTIFEAVGLQVNILTYAFGWYVMEFHGRKLVVHGGNFLNGNNVIGYLPGENLGFVLFVNTYHVIAHVLLSFHLLDAWFGRTIDYSARGLEAARMWQAGASQAINGLLAGRRLDTRPTFPLERYAGVYISPLLGEVQITWQGEELGFSYGSGHFYDGRLEHWQEDTFVVNYQNQYTDPEFLTFETGTGSRASALVWLDSSFQPIGRMNADERLAPQDRSWRAAWMSEQEQYLEPGIHWGALKSRRAAVTPGMKVQSLYIPMPDGVRLAVDLCLPDGLPAGERYPTLLYRTRYWRASELREAPPHPNPVVQFLTSHGYAVLRVDVRGTGASFGSLRYEWQPEDTRDAAALVDWILAQPWSDGRIGGYGVSYSGTTAELLAETCHPAVRAIWATYFELDSYLDIAFPGGVPSQFVQLWGQYTAALDRNISPGEDMQPDPAAIGVKPVDGDEEHALLKSAIREHSGNRNAHQLLENVIYRDDPMGGGGEINAAMAVYARRERIEASGIPIDIWGSWMDANTADTVLRHFATFRNPQRAVINAWSHGGDSFCSPFLPPDSPLELDRQGQFTELLRFMDQHLLGLDLDIPDRMLYYYTLGEEKWKASPIWPLPGSLTRRLYFRENYRLEAESPVGEGGSDRYQVDFSATTGQQNRWWTEMGGTPVVYVDRELQDRRLLLYESQALSSDLEITGYPVVSLQISSTTTDGAFFVYLEAVAPDGRVIYLTEGMLRALHRRISLEEPPYRVFGPYHSFKRRDGQALVPGQVNELRFSLCPISALVRRGHRLRVAIAGADASTFARLPAEGEVEITLLRTLQAPSWIELPIIPRE